MDELELLESFPRSASYPRRTTTTNRSSGSGKDIGPRLMHAVELVRRTSRLQRQGGSGRRSPDIRAGERIALIGESGAKTTRWLSIENAAQAHRAALPKAGARSVRALTVFHNVYMGRLNRKSLVHTECNLGGRRAGMLRPSVLFLNACGWRTNCTHPSDSFAASNSAPPSRAPFIARAACFGRRAVSAVDDHQARALLATVAEAKGKPWSWRCMTAPWPCPLPSES